MGGQITANGMTVGMLADLVGVSVRTLHHWDQIGLVTPSGRTSGGYRSYSHDDLGRVHRVLVYRALGVPLGAIAELLNGPDSDGTDQLREQHRLLRAKISELQRMSAAVDALLARKELGERLSAQEQSEIFGSAWRPEWGDEAQERWGGTEQWQQFEASAESLTPDERIALGESGTALFAEMASALRDGVDPSGPAGIALAERHRDLLCATWACTPSMHTILGRMFVDDPRFRVEIDELEAGLSGWLADAISAAARAHGVDPSRARWE